MQIVSDPIDLALLDDWQRDFPVCARPFEVLAQQLGTSEQDVINRLERMQQSGRVTRVGGTCTPNTLSASTLAAVSAPDDQIEEIAEIIGAQPGVNHNYQRENLWNLWFVATGPDRAFVQRALDNIQTKTGLEVLDLQLVRPFNVDLGFRIRGNGAKPAAPRSVDVSGLRPEDRALMDELCRGLTLSAQPYADLAQDLGLTETAVMDRITTLHQAGILARLGVIVRHRALGWRSNAMVVWDIDPDTITEAGPQLAAVPGVTLCYERRPVPGKWPYRLYNMIHARSRDEAMATLSAARALPVMADVPHKVLFSTRCFKQTGAMIAAPKGDAAA